MRCLECLFKQQMPRGVIVKSCIFSALLKAKAWVAIGRGMGFLRKCHSCGVLGISQATVQIPSVTAAPFCGVKTAEYKYHRRILICHQPFPVKCHSVHPAVSYRQHSYAELRLIQSSVRNQRMYKELVS